jgi:hypothetical protein
MKVYKVPLVFMIPPIISSNTSPDLRLPASTLPQTNIQSALDVLVQHKEKDPWKKEEIQKGLELLKESLSDFSLSKNTYKKIHDVATSLLHLNAKNGGKFIHKDQKALLEHISIASRLRALENPLTKEQAEAVLDQFHEKDNKDLLKKWCLSGLDIRAFLYNPIESRFILKAHLDKVAGYWDHEIKFSEVDQTIHMLIEGTYTNISPFVNSVYLKKMPLVPILSISRDYITDKHDPSKVWEYLPDKGLTLHNPAVWDTLPITGRLSPDEVSYAQEKAALHAQGAENGQYIVELTSLWHKPKESLLGSGLESLKSGEHPWLRIIKPDGTFHCVGFNLGKRMSAPGATSTGVFLSPDPREPFSRTARIITGIKMTEEQYKELVKQIETDQKQAVDFHFLEQNCTKFMQSVVDMLHVEVKDKPVFYSPISEVAFRAIPIGLQKGITSIQKACTPITFSIGEFIPPVIAKIFKVIGTFFRLIGERFLLLITGKQLFYLNKKDIKIQKKDPHNGIPWYKVMTHLNIAAENSLVQTFLPIKLIEWQMQVKGTRVYSGKEKFHNQYKK